MKPNIHSKVRPHLATAIIASLSLVPSQAATWDTLPTDGNITGGLGTWNLSTPNWTTDAGVSNIPWDSSTAVFGDTGGTVTVTEPVNATGITFTADGYTIASATPANILTLSGVSPVSVGAGLSSTISAIIDGTNAITLGGVGAGTLTLSGDNTYTGATTIAGGSVIASSATAFGTDAGGVVCPAGALIRLPGGIDILGESLTVSGGFTVAGVSSQGDNSWTGPITLSDHARFTSASGGTFTMDSLTFPTAVKFLLLGGEGNYDINGDITGGSAGDNNRLYVENRDNPTVSGGTVSHYGTTAPKPRICVENGTFNVEGNPTGAINYLYAGFAADQTGIFNLKTGNITSNYAVTVGAANYAIGIFNHSGEYTKLATSGSNGYILLGANLFSSGTYNLSGGTLDISSNSIYAISMGHASDSTAKFNLSGGELIMSNASALLSIGRCTSNSSNAVTQNSTGTFTQTGGSATVTRIAMGGDVRGSAIVNKFITSKLDLTGGTFTVTGSILSLSRGDDSTSEILISGTADVTLPAFPTTRGASTTSPSGFSTATITFDGGTLRPTAASATYMGGLDSAKIQDGGITFNVDTGKDIVISQDLLTDDVSLGGGITKAGFGALVLAGANTYTGATLVNEGILGLDTTGVIDAASAVTVASGASLAGSGTVGGTVTSSGSIRPGTLGVGTLTTGPTTLTAGSLDIEVSAATAGNLLSSGALNVTAIDLNVTELVAGSATSYVIAKGSSITGPFKSLNLPAGYSVTFNSTEAVLNLAASATYATWAAAYANAVPPLTDVTTTGDPDNDGLTNLMEYGLGLDPRFSSGSPGVSSNGGMTITFTKGAEAKVNLDVTYAIETSTTLGVAPSLWTEGTNPEVTQDADTISITFPAGQTENFARLKVVQVP